MPLICKRCDEEHPAGFTHPNTAEGYACERCAEQDRDSTAVGDGTLCRQCIVEVLES